MEIVPAFRMQAQACRDLGSPMYGALIDALADDAAAGGPTLTVLAGHEDDPRSSALALRLMGSVHRLVLSGRAPGLAAFYPSAGGRFERDGAVAALSTLLSDEPEAAREWLDRPPQTNEVGRAAALYGALQQVPAFARRPVRLFEIGASAGLNLLADRFAYVTPDAVHGAADSPLRLDPAWEAALPDWPVSFEERLGADLYPIDPLSDAGALTLRAYLWPDQTARRARLDAALALAAAVPAEVRRQDALSFVGEIEPVAGRTTVLWHSVMWQYLSHEDRDAITARIAELGASADETCPFLHISLEPSREGGVHAFEVSMQVWPGDQPPRRLGLAPAHGIPLRWSAT